MIGCIGKFEKVSFKSFTEIFDSKNKGGDKFLKTMREIYDSIKLPMRATTGSGGYDFYAPFDIEMEPGTEVVIPTGIRVDMPAGSVLMIAPRSGSGFKYGVKLGNTIGIVDEDFFNPDNGSEGHILLKLMNHDSSDTINFKAGDGIVQGIIVPFISFPDYDRERWEENGLIERSGGFGSTDKQ